MDLAAPCAHRFTATSPQWKALPHPTKELIQGLLRRDPLTRQTAESALHSRWMMAGNTDRDGSVESAGPDGAWAPPTYLETVVSAVAPPPSYALCTSDSDIAVADLLPVADHGTAAASAQ